MINLDTGTAIAFIADNSPIRYQLKNYVQTKQLVMTVTAFSELKNIVRIIAGIREKTRAKAFKERLIIIPDDPSSRSLNLTPNRKLGENDIIILGTGDRLGIVTMTADAKAVKAAIRQGINFHVYLHQPVPLQGV